MTRLLRNSAFNLGSQILSVAAGLVCVPIVFRELGPERFGLLTLTWSMLSYAIAFDLGTGPAVARAAATSIARDNGSRIRAIVRAGTGMQTLIGTLAALIMVALAPVALRLIRVPAEHFADAQLALYALAATIPVTLINQSFVGVLEAMERFDLIAYVRSPMQIATYAIPAAGALLHWSLARIILAIFLSRVIGMIALYICYAARRPAAQTGIARAELPELFRYGRWLAISGVIAQLVTYFDRFLLSALHGLNAVAQYGAPYDATTKLLALPGSIGVAMFPGLAKDHARGETGDVQARSARARRIVLGILVPLCLVLMLAAAPLLRLWLGAQISTDGIAAFRILLLATLFHAAAYPPVILIEASGRLEVIARYYLVELVVYLPVVIYAIAQYGVVGAAWAWAARTFGLMVWSTWYAKRY